MTNIFQFRNFREFLKRHLNLRQEKTPGYSLRQFSKELGVSHSRLSEILSSESSISMSLAVKISEGLNLQNGERAFFMDLVRMDCGRTKSARSDSLERVEDHFAGRTFQYESSSEGGLLSKWYYLPLIEMLSKSKPTRDAKIIELLGIKDDELQTAKRFLIDNGYIQELQSGRTKKSKAYLKFEKAVPTPLIRQFHKKVIAHAQDAIEAQPIEQRKFLSSFIGVRKETIKEARKELEEFNQQFLKKYASEQSADSVYCFSLQLFRFDEENT
jgi:uncharacterized protein (TIGR02147 family)